MKADTNLNIGIITRHAVPNYGSFFQAYATQKALEDMGYNVVIIDYRRADEEPSALVRNYILRDNGSLRSKIYFNYVWRLTHRITNSKFKKAHSKYLNLTTRVDNQTINEVVEGFDVLLTGSDQVWNKVGSGNTESIDPNYFWANIDYEKRRVSYAASFGDSDIETSELKKCKMWLSRYSAISVREDSGVRLVNEMELNGTQVVDPVFLLPRETWSGLATKANKKKNQIMLCYTIYIVVPIWEILYVKNLKAQD